MTSRFYITFGQAHVHSIAGRTYDKDCLAVMYCQDKKEAHDVAMELFNARFHEVHTEKDLPDIIEYFPRGVIKV